MERDEQQVQAANDFFSSRATLDEAGFFQALVVAGYPDLSKSPLATFIFNAACYDGEPTPGVTLKTLHSKLDILKETLEVYNNLAGSKGLNLDNAEACMNMGLSVLGPRVREVLTTSRKSDVKNLESLLDTESFSRYDTNMDGFIDESEVSAFALTIRVLCDVYEIMVEGDENTKGLDCHTFNKALQRIGLPNVEKTLQGQFVNSVFERADRNGNGFISLADFLRAGTRLIYPVLAQKRIRATLGYPGWEVLTTPCSEQKAADLSKIVSSLETGDILLMQGGDDGMGRYIKFSLNTPWSHVAVVVKRSPLGGIVNEKTEEILRKFPFRRAAHHFCSPGYCRCFDRTEGDFPPSRLSGCSEIGLLESTGEGIHLYDLAYRLFESPAQQWKAVALARLQNVSGRNDVERINSFIESVRGGIYTVATNELKAAISFHKSDTEATKHPACVLPKGSRSSDDFCASVVMRFFRHMGWVDDSRPSNSVMPSDFDVSHDASEQLGDHCASYTRPVELLEGKIGPLELIHCPDLDAKLPLKLPKRK